MRKTVQETRKTVKTKKGREEKEATKNGEAGEERLAEQTEKIKNAGETKLVNGLFSPKNIILLYVSI